MSLVGRSVASSRVKTYTCSDCLGQLSLSRAWLRRWLSQNAIRRIKTAEAEWSDRRQMIESGQAQSILQVLEDRGLVNQVVGKRDELDKVLIERRVGVYCGVDPTAPSLHIGHMIPFMALAWMYIYGYASTFLVGGFTAWIGDPTDRLTARDELASKTRHTNTVQMMEQLKRLGVFIERYAARRDMHREWAWRRSVKNNNEWWRKVSAGEFMRILGSNVRMGPLLGRDSVKNRLERGDGMSYAEFSYPLVQAWDWWHMFQTGTQIQIGGADQYGNIMAGADAIKVILQKDAGDFTVKQLADLKRQQSSGDPMGFTVPLLTTSTGEKFGKSAGNAVWIDPQMMNSFELYQFFLRASDADVERYLKMLTFLPLTDIATIMQEHRADESKRTAQRKLADEFVELVHGLEASQQARKQHEQLYSKTLTIEDIKAQYERPTAAADHPSIHPGAAPLSAESSTNVSIKLPRSLVYQQPVTRILYAASLVPSRSDGQRLLNAGGVYVAGKASPDGSALPATDVISYAPVTSAKWSFLEPLILDGNLLVLRVGKWKKKFITIVSDEEFKAAGLTCPGWNHGKVVDDANSAEEQEEREKGQTRAAQSAADKRKARQARAEQASPFGTITDVSM